MSQLIVYYAHPGHKFSHANAEMARVASEVTDITYVDLYRDYPRFDIDADVEQRLKEWQDLVLEHGFAYGSGGDRLEGKRLMLAITAAGPEEAYSPGGFQHYAIRDFLRPLEQTARLCGMHFPAPYVLFGSLKAPSDGRMERHVEGYQKLLCAIRDDRYDWSAADDRDIVDADSLPITEGS